MKLEINVHTRNIDHVLFSINQTVRCHHLSAAGAFHQKAHHAFTSLVPGSSTSTVPSEPKFGASIQDPYPFLLLRC